MPACREPVKLGCFGICNGSQTKYYGLEFNIQRYGDFLLVYTGKKSLWKKTCAIFVRKLSRRKRREGDGTVVSTLRGPASHHCGSRSIPEPTIMCRHALPRGFFFGFSSFPPSTKTNISKFQFDLDRWPSWKPALADVVSSLNRAIFKL